VEIQEPSKVAEAIVMERGFNYVHHDIQCIGNITSETAAQAAFHEHPEADMFVWDGKCNNLWLKRAPAIKNRRALGFVSAGFRMDRGDAKYKRFVACIAAGKDPTMARESANAGTDTNDIPLEKEEVPKQEPVEPEGPKHTIPVMLDDGRELLMEWEAGDDLVLIAESWTLLNDVPEEMVPQLVEVAQHVSKHTCAEKSL
jgi:hypothetical protein